MTQKLNWIRWLFTLALGWQLLGLAAPAHADTVSIVQPGDALNRLALRFGIGPQAPLAASHLIVTNLTSVGQPLVIAEPGVAVMSTPPPSPTPSAAATRTYIVAAGDYLHHIAIKFGVSEQALIVANGLTNANYLVVGQRLVIPAADGTTTVAQPVAADGTPAPPLPNAAPSPVPASGDSNSGNTVYVVKSGDTLWGITRRFRVGLDTLKAFNQVSNDYIHVGQLLVIPGPNATPVAPLIAGAWPPVTGPEWIPSVSWHAVYLYGRAIDVGRNPNAFSVVGDCNSDYGIYLGPVAGHLTNLTGNEYLQTTINRFWGSLTRPSLAVHGGYNTQSVMDPMWADPSQCKAGENPLACELRVSNASIVFIALGTGDQYVWRDFEKRYRAIVDFVLGQRVLPVLVTKADALESQQGGAAPGFINDVIRRLGQEYDVPVLDLWQALRNLPNGGLVWEGGQDFHLTGEGNARHNIITLQTLDAIVRSR